MRERSPTRIALTTLASAFMPGLGQLLQWRPVAAAVQFALAGVLWGAFERGALGGAGHWAAHLHWVVHLYSAIDAALYRPEPVSQSNS